MSFPARCAADREHKDYYDIMKTLFEPNMCDHFEQQADTKQKLSTYLLWMHKELSMLSECPDDVVILMNCGGQFAHHPHSVGRVMRGSTVGKAMFAGVWLACSRAIYQETFARQLVALEREDFAEDRLAEWKTLTTLETKKMRAEGHVKGKYSWPCKIKMYGCEVPLSLDFAADEAEFAYWGRLKAIAVNTRAFPCLMPWEEHLAKPGHMDGVPTEMVLLPALLDVFSVLRLTMRAIIGEKHHSLAELTRLMKKHERELTDKHRSFRLDMGYLEHCAAEALTYQVLHTRDKQ